MSPLGLTAYMPLVLPREKTLGFPDEIALVFYDSDLQYNTAAHHTSAGRAYGRLHNTLFDFNTCKSKSDFPIQYLDNIIPLQPYFLFGGDNNWQSLSVECFIGQAGSLDMLSLANNLLVKKPTGLAEVFFCCDTDCWYCWFCWSSMPEDGAAKIFDLCADLHYLALSFDGISTQPNADNEVTITGGQFFNVQF